LLDPGAQIGDWVVEKTLGEGGMGAVFRCHNTLTERISAAVKVMKPDRMADMRERFIREVEALERLQHPAIVRVKGWGEDDERGFLWLAMDMVEGEDLDQRLDRGPLTTKEAIAVFRDLADGLAHAHAANIFHRDIKPANVLLLEGGGAKLVDFGIAMESNRTRMTAAGMVPGTPAYLAPEVFSGAFDPHMLDIYAMGQALFEALTGRSGFPEQPGLSTTQRLAQLAGQKMNAKVLDPGEGVPENLRALVRRATEPDPKRRLQTMEDFRRALAGAPLSAETGAPETMMVDDDAWPSDQRPSSPTLDLDIAGPPPRKAKKASKPRRLRWVAFGGAAGLAAVVALVVVAVGIGLVLWAWPRPRDVEVVVSGMAPDTPARVMVAGREAERVGDGEFRVYEVPPGAATVTVVAGKHCDPGAAPTEGCPPCCECVETVVEDEATVVLVAVPPLPEAVPVEVRVSGVEEPWEVHATLGDFPGEPADRTTWRFPAVDPGDHALLVEAGTCPEDAHGCWPDCPDGCASTLHPLSVACDAGSVTVPVELGTPRASKRERRRAARRAQRLPGLRVKLLHRRGDIDIAERAATLLRAEGCETTVERGNEGGEWEPFWGNVYYFRDDLADETEVVRELLKKLGYLDPGHVEDDPDLDLVVWLDP